MFVSAREEPPAEFVRRRVIRVMPLYWLATLTFIAIGLWEGVSFSRLDILRSLLLIPFHNPGHEAQIWPLLVPGWTLMYEMFFYAIFAVGLLRGRVLSTVTLVIVVLIAGGLLTKPASAVGATYTDPRMLEFLAGLWLAKANEHFNFRHLWPLLPIGLAALPILDWGKAHMMLQGFMPAVAIVAGARALEARRCVKLFVVPKMLGDASYSIYLSHTLTMIWTDHLVASIQVGGWVQFVIMIAVTFTGAVVVGLVVYRWLEKPLLIAGMRLIESRVVSRSLVANNKHSSVGEAEQALQSAPTDGVDS